MANSDKRYVDMLNLMRKQGSKDNPVTLELGIMQGSDSVKIGDLVLDKDDILIADHLLAGYSYKIETPYVSVVNFTPETVTTKDTIVKTTGLKKGDIVAVMKLSANDTYVILAKVVSV